MDRKYQIFVSSTYEDLRDERNEVIKACLNMGHIPVGMEMFNAADEEQWAVITRTIDQCDYYVVIVAHRYGSTTPQGLSFTEKEYDYAVAKGVPVLGFVIEDGASWPNDRIDKDASSVQGLESFKSKVRQKMVRFWHSAQELRSQFVESLATSINTKPQRGWVRAPEATDVDVAQVVSNLTEENAKLRAQIQQLDSKKSTQDTIVKMLLNRQIEFDVLSSGVKNNISGAELFILVSRNLVRAVTDRRELQEKLKRSMGFEFEREQFSAFIDELMLLGLINSYLPGGEGILTLSDRGKSFYVFLHDWTQGS